MSTRQLTVHFVDNEEAERIDGVSGIGCEGSFLIVEIGRRNETVIYPAGRIRDVRLTPPSNPSRFEDG